MMGSAESREQVTPARPLKNKHFSHVTDPRSPTAGIPRTPIELGDSPRRPPQSCPEEETLEMPVMTDPRSPTHGIARTPLRPPALVALNLLAKQLSEVFVADDPDTEGNLMVSTDLVSAPTEGPGGEAAPTEGPGGEAAPTEGPGGEAAPTEGPGGEAAPREECGGEAAPLEEPAEQTVSPPSVDPPEEEKEAVPVVSASQVASESPLVKSMGSSMPKTRCKSPRSAGKRNVRQRTRKALVSASTSGRSPLKILQEDNSPNTTVQHRQGKKLYFQPEPPSCHRALKISQSSWETSHNKENAQYGES
ncbi:cell division cycle-associated protein 3 isoform 1-T3 [Discoglossus pictus]